VKLLPDWLRILSLMAETAGKRRKEEEKHL